MPKLFNRNCAVVYVDDSPDDHFLFQRAVSKSETPLHIQPFFSAEPAIAYLKGEPPFGDSRVYPFPAFLLVDHDLKLSEAPKLVMAVRAIPSCATLPIIVFSGSDDESCVLSSYLAGADHYLCKPTHAERLGALVRSLYNGAMLTPCTFRALTAFKEYQPCPAPTKPTRSSACAALSGGTN